ncbi:unnamed protein product [Discosporangium mesarthrocarpum]
MWRASGSGKAFLGSTRRRNIAVAVAILGFSGAMASVPFVVRKRAKKSLYDSEEGLTGTQIQRGPFMNTGSKDVGRDEDWDLETRTWKGSYGNRRDNA